MLQYREYPFINDLIAGKKCWIKPDIYLQMLTDLKSVQDAIRFYWETAMKHSPFSQFKARDDPQAYLNELMALAETILNDQLSYAAYDKEGNLVACGTQQDYTSQVIYPESNSFIMRATSAFEDECVNQLITAVDLKDVRRGQVAYALVGCVSPKYQGSGVLDVVYSTVFQLNRAKGYRYSLSVNVSPKMIKYLIKVATQVYVGQYTILKFEDFDFHGEKPLKEIKFFSKEFGIDDGVMALLIDNYQPIKPNKDIIAKL